MVLDLDIGHLDIGHDTQVDSPHRSLHIWRWKTRCFNQWQALETSSHVQHSLKRPGRKVTWLQDAESIWKSWAFDVVFFYWSSILSHFFPNSFNIQYLPFIQSTVFNLFNLFNLFILFIKPKTSSVKFSFTTSLGTQVQAAKDQREMKHFQNVLNFDVPWISWMTQLIHRCHQIKITSWKVKVRISGDSCWAKSLVEAFKNDPFEALEQHLKNSIKWPGRIETKYLADLTLVATCSDL